MASITFHLLPSLLTQVQALAGSPENLQTFLIQAIEHEVKCQQAPAIEPRILGQPATTP